LWLAPTVLADHGIRRRMRTCDPVPDCVLPVPRNIR